VQTHTNQMNEYTNLESLKVGHVRTAP